MIDFLRLALMLLAAVNPPAIHRRAAGTPRSRDVAIVAGAFAFGLVVLAAVLAGPLLDALDIEPETFRIATGVVMLVSAILALVPFAGSGPDEPKGRLAGLAPWGWPRLANPAVVAISLSWSADGERADVIAAAFVPVVLGAGALLAGARWRPVSLALSVLLAALLIVFGVGRVVSGVRDI